MERKLFLRIRIAASFLAIIAIAEHSPELVYYFWQFILLIAVIGILGMTIYDDAIELSDMAQKKSAQGGHPKALN